VIAEILGPDGRIHYRRPPDDPLVDEARATPGYSVRMVETETVESPRKQHLYSARNYPL
jgi:hypothetical protein